jgi:hypothetical protein
MQPSADWMSFSYYLPMGLRDFSDVVQFWRMRTYICPIYKNTAVQGNLAEATSPALLLDKGGSGE